MKPDLPVWRSLMYVPVNVEKYVDKAHTRGARREDRASFVNDLLL